MASGVILRPSAMANEEINWQSPRFETPPEFRYGWLNDLFQEGQGWLESQSAYANLPQNLRIFDGVFADRSKSTLRTNFLKYNLRKFVETLSEVREIALYGTDASQYKPYADIINKVAKCIYKESEFPRQLRKALQFSTLGQGYLWPKCKAEDYGYGERRIVFEPLGILDVVPVQVPNTNNVQDAYMNTIVEYMPIAESHGRFPLFQSRLKPLAMSKYNSRVEARRMDMAEKYRYGAQRNWGYLYCEIRYTFIRDLRINDTGHELPMGDEGTSWFYKVPYVGQDIFGGFRDGQPFMRPAKAEDCRIYPQLRLMIWSPEINTPMYDGPAFDWHGQMPAVQYVVDDWPWEPMSLSLIQDVGSIEMTKRKHERKMDQVLTTRLNPPLGYDRTATGGPKIENFDIFEENIRAGVDGKPRDIMQSLLPEEVNVDEKNFKFLEMLSQMEEKQLGINDLGNLLNMKLNMSSDAFDKAVEAVGPIAKGIAASMESGNARLGYMLKFMIVQWFDTKRVIEYIGPDNIKPEVFDFDPDSVVPSHMPDEVTEGIIPLSASRYDKLERAKRFARNLRLTSVPSTLVKITALQEQTKYLALKGRGAPISWHTVMQKLDVQNYGEIEGSTEWEKFINEEVMMLKLKAAAQALATQLGIGAPEHPSGKQHGGGRPPTDKQAPKQKMKDQKTNPRPIISTSG